MAMGGGAAMIELPSESDVARLVAAACRVARLRGAARARRRRRPGVTPTRDTALAGRAVRSRRHGARSALALTPADAALWRDLAGVYDGGGDPVRARACLLRAIELDPANPHGWLLLAGIEGRCGDKRGAEAAYRRAIELDPALAEAHLGLGLLCVEQQRFEEAAERLRAAAVHAPDDRLVRSLPRPRPLRRRRVRVLRVGVRRGRGARAARRRGTQHLRLRADLAGHDRWGRASGAGRLQGAGGRGADDIATVARTAFLLLSGIGHRAAAAELGRLRLAADPNDPVQRICCMP